MSTGGLGTVFKLDNTGMKTVLHDFTGGLDGGFPFAGLLRDREGSLYGTTSFGGAVGAGTVYKVDNTGTESVLYSFTGGLDGGTPYAGLIQDGEGNFYGTASAGGASNVGTVFKLHKSGTLTLLYAFTGGADGATPYAGLVRDRKGNLYGTTSAGGASNMGTVFKVSKGGKETVLYSFTGGSDGGTPYASLVRDDDGNLYGTTSAGMSGFGTVFKLKARERSEGGE